MEEAVRGWNGKDGAKDASSCREERGSRKITSRKYKGRLEG